MATPQVSHTGGAKPVAYQILHGFRHIVGLLVLNIYTWPPPSGLHQGKHEVELHVRVQVPDEEDGLVIGRTLHLDECAAIPAP